MPGANFLMNFPKPASAPQEELLEHHSLLASAMNPEKLKTPPRALNKTESQVEEHRAPSTPPNGISFTHSGTGEAAK